MMDDFWARDAEIRRNHDAKYPDHTETEIWTCIDCYEIDIAKEERERIIKNLEKRLCFEKYDCPEDRCKIVMDFIAIVRDEK